MPKNKKEERTADNTYGGVRYRFSYADSLRAASLRRMRLMRRGSRSFWLAVSVVGVFCFSALAVSVVYKIAAKDGAGASAVVDKETPAITVSARVTSEEKKYYPNRFAVSKMNESAREVYHLPSGVMVSEVYESEDGVNGGVLKEGDIIVAVNGLETPGTDSFHAVFSSARKNVTLSVYRQEKNLSLEYVIDHEE